MLLDVDALLRRRLPHAARLRLATPEITGDTDGHMTLR